MNEPNGDHFYASNILKCTAGVWTKRCYRRGRKLSTKTKKDKYQSAILMYETFRLELREKNQNPPTVLILSVIHTPVWENNDQAERKSDKTLNFS